MRYLLPIALCLILIIPSVSAQPSADGKLPTIAEKTTGAERSSGFFTYYWDAKSGKIWLAIAKFDAEFLYVGSLPAGVGSNDIGLDRGQYGGIHVVRFERTGPKILLIEPNYSYRAVTDAAAERKAVDESFARSVLWGFDVAAASGDTVLVDATSFFLRDAHNVAGTIKAANQGNYRLDPSRSAFYLPRTKNFPKNTEVEVTLTFAGDDPGGYLQSVTPSAQSVTVREHHTFLELPDNGYHPRRFDPRGGFFYTEYYDYATPVGEPVSQKLIVRHRLEKKDPSAAVSEPVKPILYYLDRGVPVVHGIVAAVVRRRRDRRLSTWRTALVESAAYLPVAHAGAGVVEALAGESVPGRGG